MTWVLIISLWYGNSYPLTTISGYSTREQCLTAVNDLIEIAEKGQYNHFPMGFCIHGPSGDSK